MATNTFLADSKRSDINNFTTASETDPVTCNKAIEFDGTDDIVSISSTISLSGDFTIEFWAKLNAEIDNKDQVMGNLGTNHNINFFQAKIRIFDGANGFNSSGDKVIATTATSANTWNHYTFVREATTLKIYINGTLNNTKSTTWTADFLVSKLGSVFNNTGYLDGKLDEIRLWDIARTTSEISSNYTKTMDPSTSGLKAYWRFNESTDTQSITDLTTHGYTAIRGSSHSATDNDATIVDSELTIEGECPTYYIYNEGWTDSNNPNGVSVSMDYITIESGNATMDTNTTSNTIIVQPGASLTINTGLIITSDINLGSSSTSYSSLILDGIINGDVSYQRHVNNAAGTGETTGNNDLISAPLTGQTFGDFRAANSNIHSGTISGNPAFLFGPFSPSTNAYIIYSATDDSSTLDAGVGYRTGSRDNGTFTFTGTVEKQEVSTPITSGGASNWNLIGNPYPSYISAQDFLNDLVNTGLIDENAVGIYGYDGAAQDGWKILNLLTTTAADVIAPGQGFFVNAEASGNISFTPEMRRTSTADDFIDGRDATTALYLKLNATTDTDSYSTAVYFNENASLGLDPGYDASVWGGSPSNFSIYSRLVEGDLGKAFALQALNSDDLANSTIALGVNANQGTTLKFSIAESTLPDSVNVYLEDALTNTHTLLTSSDYEIQVNSNLNGTGRFYLHFSEITLSTAEITFNALKISVNQDFKTIEINGLVSQKTTANLYDIQGRLLNSFALDKNVNTQSFTVNKLTTGIYIVELQNETASKTQKVIIK